jgi:hypothetical protein
MENPAAFLTDPQQYAQIQRKLILDNRIRGGVGWFYWIAGLSLVNTVAFLVGIQMHFVVGLAITQIIDGFLYALTQGMNTAAGGILRALGLFLDVAIAGFFALLGFFGRKRYAWVVILGMGIYFVDAVLMIVFQDWLAAAFHALALYGLWTGWRAIRQLAALDKTSATQPVEVLREQYAQVQSAPRISRGGRIVFYVLIAVMLISLAIVVIFTLTQSQ